MTIEKLIKITKDLPRDAKVMSDSGWECDATDCDRAYYSPTMNTIVLTQIFDREYNKPFKVTDESGHGWKWLNDWREL